MPIERYKRLLIFCCVYDIITVEKHIAGVCCYGGMFGYLPILILGGASFAGSLGTKRYECQTIWDIAKKYRVDPERLMSDNAESIAPDGRLNGKRYITIR